MRRGFALPILFLLAGCTASAPLLRPTVKGTTAPENEVIQVIVKPITTQGFGSEDEKRWGVDLSAYFTAFYVTLVNRTKEAIAFDPRNAVLLDDSGEKRVALNRTESIRYYREGDDPSRVVLIPKSKARINEEVAKIDAARLTGGRIGPGGEKSGLILFRKVRRNQCRSVLLALEAVTVIRTGEKKRFTFPFSCGRGG